MKINFDFLKQKGLPEVPSVGRESDPSILRKNIESIEKSILGNWDKASLVLLELDRKKIADIADRKAYTTPAQVDEIRQRLQAHIETVLALASSLGLQMHNSGIQAEEVGSIKFLYFVIILGKDPKYIEQEKTANEDGDVVTTGKLRGYPDTAAEWYGRNHKSVSVAEHNSFILNLRKEGLEQSEIRRLTQERFPFLKEPTSSSEVIKREGLGQFMHFRLSPEHWKDELDVVRQNRDAIRINAPKLYAELTGR